ncbi:MAG: response regulator [Nitrospirae bacterium]|nr:response regulator [Nitrospirota bacterium]
MDIEKQKILIVDDAVSNIEIINDALQDDYITHFATNAKKALEVALSTTPDLILLDVVMPDMGGYELFGLLKKEPSLKDASVIFVTALNGGKDESIGLELGAVDYITKPINQNIVKLRVKNHLALKRQAVLEKQQMQQELVEQNLNRVRRLFYGAVEALTTMAETRDPYTAGHQRRVAQLARAIAQDMMFSKDDLEGLCIAAMLHDIGKVNVPAEILSKPGKITEIEFSLIKTHSEVGYNILKSIHSEWQLADVVYQHHEKLDGSGYPRGLRGDSILLAARVITVADVVEAISSHRPYRAALGPEIAMSEITSRKGICYDEDVVDVCVDLFEKGFVFNPAGICIFD